MKKSISLIFLGAALAALVSGCTTEPTEDGTGFTHIPSDSIQYHEIRIDAFSHYWETQKLMATHVGGGSIVTTNNEGDSIFALDSLRLFTSAYDKTASLPEHALLEMPAYYGPISRLVYKAASVPQTFSCYFYNHGKSIVGTSTEDTLSFLYERSSLFLNADTLIFEQSWYKVQDELERMEPIRCGYIPGQGFYLGDRNYDDYGTYVNSVGGEFVIRY
jgi:hypothetical protein